MIVELRTYRLKAGCCEAFLEAFRAKSMPAHAEIGMKIAGPWVSLEEPDTFFFMRGFPDMESREPMKAKFYEGELWKRELEAQLMPMIVSYEVVLVEMREDGVKWT
ncbi:NIPSNAP family protein [Candidatus Korobacter versatilis]|nr:NIPSNAP family protein [Candidatus Koribacter versatilis]